MNENKNTEQHKKELSRRDLIGGAAAIATWFLIRETRRGEKIYACTDGSTGSHSVVLAVASSLRPQIFRLGNTFCKAQKQAEGVGSFSSL